MIAFDDPESNPTPAPVPAPVQCGDSYGEELLEHQVIRNDDDCESYDCDFGFYDF